MISDKKDKCVVFKDLLKSKKHTKKNNSMWEKKVLLIILLNDYILFP